MSESLQGFKIYIQSLLQKAHINEEYRIYFTDDEGLALFLKAFTHPTFDANVNYEELEYIGDGILKGCMKQYLLRKFPNIKEEAAKSKISFEGIMSKLIHWVEKGDTLATVANKLNLWAYVRGDDHTMNTNKKKVTEDVLEAFIGALVQIVDDRVKIGLGYHYAYIFTTNILDTIVIPQTLRELEDDDPVTTLGEWYKANKFKNDKEPLRWDNPIYKQTPVNILKVYSKPASGKPGDLVFIEPLKQVFVYTTEWIPITSATNETYFNLNTGLSKDDTESGKAIVMYYNGVYGFFVGDTPVKFESIKMDKKYIKIPQVSVLSSNARLGDVEFRTTDRQTYVYTHSGWTLSSKVHPNFKINMEEIKMDKDILASMIIENPEKYNAKIIGQSIAFKTDKSKAAAAKQAMQYLRHLGYERLPNPDKKVGKWQKLLF